MAAQLVRIEQAAVRFRVGPPDGVIAQLVERLNGIEKVRSSNLLGSTIFIIVAL